MAIVGISASIVRRREFAREREVLLSIRSMVVSFVCKPSVRQFYRHMHGGSIFAFAEAASQPQHRFEGLCCLCTQSRKIGDGEERANVASASASGRDLSTFLELHSAQVRPRKMASSDPSEPNSLAFVSQASTFCHMKTTQYCG
ncbi:hypothetical protein KC363_g33 [Hortaea werneckii]|nr:hypothetical protein KC363_g33 [Hortaea werneckii]